MNTPTYSQFLNRRTMMWATEANKSRFDAPTQVEFAQLIHINRKHQGYEFAKKCGVACVPHQVFKDIDAALAGPLPERFVVKPLGGHSSAGVFLIETRSNGRLWCHMTNRGFDTKEALAARYKKRLAKSGKFKMSVEILREDYVEDSLGFDVPLDYKVYGFYTGAVLVMQRYAPVHLPYDQWAFVIYDRNGTDQGQIRWKTDTHPDVKLSLPDNFDDLIKATDTLVRQARVSFVRTDLYSTPNGVVFGEFTPVPNAGKESFTPEYETLLGQHWQNSIEELGLTYFKNAP
ncbi:ATP-grasp fold amidoligase family protein [Neptunicoccus sediminis]|uniref:ATP-grasp fold amidoligase family protein n=1 Tax=Neptunicoccus sediminis TaxID=1892596 RepID=UPI000845D23B|nr:ATP-grasp fold amidoligase family protein [Neptunicoccus sediminis]